MKKEKITILWSIIGIALLTMFIVFYQLANHYVQERSFLGTTVVSVAFAMISLSLYRYAKAIGPNTLAYVIYTLFTVITFLYVFFTNLVHFSDFVIPKLIFVCTIVSFIIAIIARRKYQNLIYSTIYMFLAWIFSLLSYGSLVLGL